MRVFLTKMVASVFFIGYIPFGSGSWCSLLCSILLYLFKPTILIHSSLIITTFLLGTWSASECEKTWGKDNRKIVIDEFIGMLITMFLIPIYATNLFLGFLLFRFYDILKPFFIRTVEKRIRGGLGVMLDDVLAGIMANLTLRLMLSVF